MNEWKRKENELLQLAIQQQPKQPIKMGYVGTNGWMHGWKMNEWMNKWMDGWVNGNGMRSVSCYSWLYNRVLILSPIMDVLQMDTHRYLNPNLPGGGGGPLWPPPCRFFNGASIPLKISRSFFHDFFPSCLPHILIPNLPRGYLRYDFYGAIIVRRSLEKCTFVHISM